MLAGQFSNAMLPSRHSNVGESLARFFPIWLESATLLARAPGTGRRPAGSDGGRVAMASIIDRPQSRPKESRTDHQRLDDFLAELGELSRRFGLAIGDGACLYLMEPEDFARSYTADDESALTFS